MPVELSAEDRAFLAQPWIARMTVIDSQGYPHTMPVWYLLEGDELWITTSRNTKKVDHLLANPKGNIQIGGEPGQGGVAFSFKGDFSVAPDADYAFLRKVTYHYEPRDVADAHLADWAQGEILILRFHPHWKVRFQV